MKIEVNQPSQMLTTNSFFIYIFCRNYKHDIVFDLQKCQNNFRFANCTKYVNFGLIEEIMDLPYMYSFRCKYLSNRSEIYIKITPCMYLYCSAVLIPTLSATSHYHPSFLNSVKGALRYQTY